MPGLVEWTGKKLSSYLILAKVFSMLIIVKSEIEAQMSRETRI